MMHNLFKLVFYSLMILSCASIIIGCAHKKDDANVASDEMNINVREHIVEADKKIKRAYEEQWDVLAFVELRKSADHFEKAKKYYTEGGKLEKISEELRQFDTMYKEAQLLAEVRAPNVEGLLASRRKALDSEEQHRPEFINTLAGLDQKLRDLSNNKTISTSQFSKLQEEYLKLASGAIKNKNLSNAARLIEFAKSNKARRYAPRTLRKAELDYKTAENMIEANMTDKHSYDLSVKKANLSAEMLAQVVEEQRKVNFKLDEMTAQRIVNQSQLLNQLNSDLKRKDEELYYSQSDLKDYQNELDNSQEEIAKKNKELAEAEKEKVFQETLDKVQQNFSKDEADVYRQGDKVLIRLKKIQFPVGQAAIPAKSKALLNKVSEVAKKLGPKEIVVEGHTDSIGSFEENYKISQERADSVKDYLEKSGLPKSILESEGFGYEKPLSSNKTKAGRAQNRRVDVWITPAQPQAITE